MTTASDMTTAELEQLAGAGSSVRSAWAARRLAERHYGTRRPLYRQTPARRREVGRLFVGRRVVLTATVYRAADSRTRDYAGVLLSVAYATVGTVAELFVIRLDSGGDVAVSGATVVTIQEV